MLGGVWGGGSGGGAWFRSVRRFVRFRAFSSVLLRFRLITGRGASMLLGEA